MHIDLPYPPTPEYAAMFAALARESAWQVSRVDLDDTSKTLAKVDDILERMRDHGIAPEHVGGTLFMFGCYVGEVFVREYGATWVETAKTPMRDVAGHPIIVQLNDDAFCNPIGKVWKRLANGEEDSLVFFFKAFASKAPGRPSQWRKLWR